MHDALPFVRRALALKDTPRRGWLRAIGPHRRCESVADHTWGVALLALATDARADVGRLLETALVHDLAEAATGDLLPGEYRDREEKAARERAALLDMLEGAPTALRTRLLARLDEYAAGSTAEARLVRDLDKVEMALQADRYEAAGVPAPALVEFRASARAAVRDPALRSLLG